MWSVRLFRDDQLPSVFHEPFIKSGYRACETSLSECLRSALQRTNETLNFWTHFLPLFYYLWRIWHLNSCLNFINNPFTWPLLGELLTICLYLLASSIAHLFQCLSERARHVCFLLDYSSIGLYSLGCCISYKYYSFPENLMNTTYFDIYIPIGVVNAILLCTCCACASRFMDESLQRHLCRLSSFGIPFLICNIPIFYRITVCPGDECHGSSVTLLRWQYVAAFLTAFIFATHLPERIAPGKFDVFFHSHQLFHITAAIASNLHVDAMLVDMEGRRAPLDFAVGEPKFWGSIGLLLVVFCLQGLLVVCFSIIIFRQPEPYHVYKLLHNESIEKRQLAKNYRYRTQIQRKRTQFNNRKRD